MKCTTSCAQEIYLRKSYQTLVVEEMLQPLLHDIKQQHRVAKKQKSDIYLKVKVMQLL